LSRLALTLSQQLPSLRAARACQAWVALYASAGSTPWFAAEEAALVEHCESVNAPSKRQTCLLVTARQRAAIHLAA
jgi:hypothetical protein